MVQEAEITKAIVRAWTTSRDTLTALRTSVFRRIEQAARSGDTTEVNRLARVANECDEAIAALERIEAQSVRLESELNDRRRLTTAQKVAAPNTVMGPAKIGSQISKKRKGNDVRAAYLKVLFERFGIRLLRGRKRAVVYQTESGRTIGMPSATELSDHPNRWWLGLPNETFDLIVLLCESDSGELLDFVFPSDFVSEIWPVLSRDGKGQLKFHVSRTGERFELELNNGVKKEIHRFLGGGAVLL